MSVEDKRFLAKTIIVCVLVLAAIVTIHIIDEPKVEAWEYHTAQYGDNLWDIAKEYNPSYEGDLRDITYCIRKANDMKDNTVYVGLVYEVPIME